MARVVTGGTDSTNRYTWYCRICGAYIKAVSVPQSCPECGNIEVDEGFGCSGDADVSNTTVTANKVSDSYTRAGTIDKTRRH